MLIIICLSSMGLLELECPGLIPKIIKGVIL